MSSDSTNSLLNQMALGSIDSRERLFARFRKPLRNMVASRMDQRLTARFDASDVVQEAFITAAKQMDDYLTNRPVPVYPWLRAITQQRLIDLHRRHALAGARSVFQENVDFSSSGSLNRLCEKFISPEVGPAELVIHKETNDRVKRGLSTLSDAEQEILMMRYLERMKAKEIGEVLEITESAVKQRVRRALERLQKRIGKEGGPA